MTAADVRVPHARPIVTATGVVAALALLWLTRTYSYYFDEWTFITTAPDWTFTTLFVPHNEQPSMLFRALYWLLLNTFGLRTYLPYMTVTIALHVVNVVLLFELVRRRCGDLIGLCTALLLLFLGAGWEDLLWAFQMAWLASVALGLAALLVGQPPARIVAPALLIAASLAFSAVGAPFAIALTVQLLWDRSRRRQAWWLAGVAAAFALWFLAFGHQIVAAHHPSPTNALVDPLYAFWGLAQSLAGLAGESGWAGAALLAAAVVVLAWRWSRHGVDGFVVGSAAGLAGFYLLTGLARAQMGWQQSGASRYTYVGAVMWLLLLSDAARGLPWRGTWRPALAALVFLACFNDAVVLFEFAVAKTAQMAREQSDLHALNAERTDPCLNPDGAVDALVMPFVTPPLYYRAVDRYGNPATLPISDHDAYATALQHLRKAGC